MTQTKILVTLRHNIGIESDIRLALSEFESLLGKKTPIKSITNKDDINTFLEECHAGQSSRNLISHHLRDQGVIAFEANDVAPDAFIKIVTRMGFAQEIAYYYKENFDTNIIASKLIRTEKNANGTLARAVSLSALLDYSTKLVFARESGTHTGEALDAILDYLLDRKLPEKGLKSAILAAIAAKKTTLYLTHELHLYKGKFFPRMVRSLMNRYIKSDDAIIVDPFVGSGTALLEASLLGLCSIGVDVDPTSVLISQCKLTPSNIDSEVMESVGRRINSAIYGSVSNDLFESDGCYSISNWMEYKIEAPEPMRGRLIKRGNEEGYDLLGEIENDSAKALCLIDQTPAEIQPLLRVCLSHALTKKLRLRFVGIGNGRFTIDVAKTGVLDLFAKKAFHLIAVTEAFEWLKNAGIKLTTPKVIRGSAKNFNEVLNGEKVDLILTSPPYIPASSGREHYARARAIPLVFTKAATLDELDTLDQDFIGEMSAQTDSIHLEEMMPPAIRATLKFLRTDQQRLPKYLPTLNYYVDLEKVLEQTRDSLKDTGRALFVVGTSHTFYIHKTKEILHTVDASKAIAELGEKVGLVVEETINIPLKKSGGLNARPRSTDEYSESVVVFKRAVH